MKKKFLMIILLVGCLFCLTACEKKEGRLIEICDLEFENNFQNKDFIIGFTNEYNANNDEFIADLETYASQSKKTIYYMDIKHLTMYTETILFEDSGLDYGTLTYAVVQDGSIVAYNEYTGLTDIRINLKNYNFNDEIEFATDDEINDLIEKSQNSLDEQKISTSLYYLNEVWTKDAAKYQFNSYPYYYYVGTWDNYSEENGYKVYTKIETFSLLDYTFIATTKNKDEYVKPEDSEYIKYYYYEKNGIIYISEDNENYKEFAKIKYASRTKLVLERNGKEYIYLPEE